MAKRVTKRPSHRITQTVNEQLVDVQARNAFLAESHANRDAIRSAARIEREVFDKVGARIDNQIRSIRRIGTQSSRAVNARLSTVLRQINKTVDKGFAAIAQQTEGQLVGLARTEAQLQLDVLKQRIPKGVKLRVPGKRELRKLATSEDVLGKPMRTWIDELRRKTRSDIAQTVRHGMRQQHSASAIKSNVRAIAKTQQRHAATLARTAQNDVMNRARMATLRENRRAFSGYQWVSVLDGRTSDICLSLDGRTFRFGRGPQPPAHFNCRSTITGVVKNWRKLPGVKAKDLTTSEKRSLDGKPPKKQTAFEWLRKQPKSVQQEALGKTRAKMLRGGTLNEKNIVKRNGKTRTLKELRRAAAQESVGIRAYK